MQVCAVKTLHFSQQIQFVLYAVFVAHKPQCVAPRFANLLQEVPTNIVAFALHRKAVFVVSAY